MMTSTIAGRARANRRASIIANSRMRNKTREPPIMWNIQGMRGQMSSNCLWHACKAFFVGLLLFMTGIAMCVYGFYADGLFEINGNSTEAKSFVNHDDPSRPIVKFSKLSYIGPIIMGIGGFIIVATCVMTFEARDSAAKVGPAILGGTRSSSNVFPLACRSRVKNIDVRSVGSQTHGSAMSLSTVHLFDKKLIMDTFRKFSRTLRSSTSISSSQGEQLHRSPSAPSLLNTTVLPNLTRSSRLSPYQPKSRASRVPPAFRQAMSVDCTSPPVVPAYMSNSLTASTQTFPARPATTTSSSRARAFYRNVSTASEGYASTGGERSSSGIMTPPAGPSSVPSDDSVLRSVHASVHNTPETVELHLPNGLVTLSVMRSFGGSGSSTSLRTLSPHPSCYSDDSFDRPPCAKIESSSRSPVQKAVSFKTELSTCRPVLMRQTKVDCSEIIYVEDSDDESTILEEDLGTIQELE